MHCKTFYLTVKAVPKQTNLLTVSITTAEFKLRCVALGKRPNWTLDQIAAKGLAIGLGVCDRLLLLSAAGV